jgi:hypothetical protein
MKDLTRKQMRTVWESCPPDAASIEDLASQFIPHPSLPFSEEDVALLYKRGDVFLSPSQVDNEILSRYYSDTRNRFPLVKGMWGRERS